MIKFNAILKNSSTTVKILTLSGLFLFFGLMGIAIWKIFTTGDPNDISSIKTLQIFTQIGAFIIPALFIGTLCSHDPSRYLYLEKRPTILRFLSVVAFMIAIIPFINSLGQLNHQIEFPTFLKDFELWLKTSEQNAAQTTELLLNVNTTSGFLLNIFVIALLPAISEELFFRGALQKIISERRNIHVAIWFTAFIFSSIHFQFYGFIPRFLIGAFFGYLLYWSGSIWLPVTAHFINNLVSVTFYYLQNKGYNLPNIDTIGTGNNLWVGLLSGIIALIVVIIFKRYFRKVN